MTSKNLETLVQLASNLWDLERELKGLSSPGKLVGWFQSPEEKLATWSGVFPSEQPKTFML